MFYPTTTNATIHVKTSAETWDYTVILCRQMYRSSISFYSFRYSNPFGYKLWQKLPRLIYAELKQVKKNPTLIWSVSISLFINHVQSQGRHVSQNGACGWATCVSHLVWYLASPDLNQQNNEVQSILWGRYRPFVHNAYLFSVFWHSSVSEIWSKLVTCEQRKKAKEMKKHNGQRQTWSRETKTNGNRQVEIRVLWSSSCK